MKDHRSAPLISESGRFSGSIVMFDPYEKWLGISPDQRPINYYHLLGVSPKEKDPDVIEKAAVKRAAKVKGQDQEKHAQTCARLLKQIDQARATLLDPARRKEYDARLGKT